MRNEALHNHADGLEGAHKEFVMVRGELLQVSQLADGKTESIASRVNELFQKTDQLLEGLSKSESEMRGLVDARLSELQGRVAELEIAAPAAPVSATGTECPIGSSKCGPRPNTTFCSVDVASP